MKLLRDHEQSHGHHMVILGLVVGAGSISHVQDCPADLPLLMLMSQQIAENSSCGETGYSIKGKPFLYS